MVVESDKADMDVETFYDGILAAILVAEGEVILTNVSPFKPHQETLNSPLNAPLKPPKKPLKNPRSS